MRIRFLPRMDLYVTRSVAWLMLCSTIVICFLVGLIDSFQHMDEFLDFAETQGYSFIATAFLVLKYYMCLTPQYFVQFMIPFVSMLSGVIAVSVMASHREFTVLRASGVPLQRVLLPALGTILCIGMLVFLIRDSVLPSLARTVHAISEQIKPKQSKPVTIVHTENDEIRLYSIGHFDSTQQMAYNLRLEIRDLNQWKNGQTDLYRVIEDATVRLEPGKWRFTAPTQYVEGPYGTYPMKSLLELPTQVTPAMLEQEAIGTAVLTTSDLQTMSQDLSKAIELAQRRAVPFAGVVILLVGIAFVIRTEVETQGKGIGRIKSIFLAMLVCAAYYLVQVMFIGVAERNILGPNLAAWMPNLIFGAWGGYAYWKVNH